MRRLLPLVVLALALALPGAGRATILKAFDLPQLSGEAHVVVRGLVQSQAAEWNEDHSRIYTYSEIDVLERVKGRTPDRITVKQLGGTVDGRTLSVVANADLQVGEEVVLFLRTDGAFHYIVGMHQGKYGVRREAAGAFVTRDPLSRPAPAATPTTGATTGPDGRPALAPQPSLDSLLRDVRRHVDAAARGQR